MVYDDLPEELQKYFPAESVSISLKRDLDARVQKAVQAATESLLKQFDMKDLNL